MAGNLLAVTEGIVFGPDQRWALRVDPDTKSLFLERNDGTKLTKVLDLADDAPSFSFVMGTGTGLGLPSMVVNINTTAVGNVGVGEDDLMTYSLPADSCNSNGRTIRVTAWGTTANNVNAKTVKLHFGATVILTTALTVSQVGVWKITAEIVRTGASAQEAVASLLQGGATTLVDVEQSAPSEAHASAITIKATGTATANNDVVQEGMIVEFLN